MNTCNVQHHSYDELKPLWNRERGYLEASFQGHTLETQTQIHLFNSIS